MTPASEEEPMTIHRFDNTGEAYDACQCDEDIKTGDMLVIEEKGWRGHTIGHDDDGFRIRAFEDKPIDITVVGLAWAWPLAVTVQQGELHAIEDTIDAYRRVVADAGITLDQVRAAIDTATDLDAPVRPLWLELAA
jgi:hypothetical protein